MIVQYPRAQRVTALEPYKLKIRWSTGETLGVDLAERLLALPALAHVRDPQVFRRVHVSGGGTSIEWVDSELGADNVYAWTREQMGEASHEMFHAWMVSNRLKLEETATELGLSRRMVAYYRSGQRRIPKHVWLACQGWESSRRRPKTKSLRAAQRSLC